MRRAFLCDFDGTVAPQDVGAALVRRFSVAPAEEMRARLERWRSGAIGHRALTEATCRTLDLSREEALAFTRDFALDPAFGPFARRAARRGDRVVVVSEGFDFYIEDLLARAGLGEVAWMANRARFSGRVLTPEFPHAASSCAACGNCKARHVRRCARLGYRTVFVGDGLSDRCGARAADQVFARGDLLEWCRREGIPARDFEGFDRLAEAPAA